MSIEIKVPTFPESVSEGEIAAWHFKEGESFAEGDILAEIETDKVVMEIPAAESGKMVKQLKAEGDTVTSEEVIGQMEAGAAPAPKAEAKPEPKADAPAEKAAPKPEAKPESKPARDPAPESVDASPSIRRKIAEQGLSSASQNLLAQLKSQASSGQRVEKREPMSRLRKTVAKRLLDVQSTTAMLTTFNEVDMKPIMNIRAACKDDFEEKYGVKLGFMSFFLKAATMALKAFPAVNASIDGEDIVYHGYQDISVAVSSPRGLVTPVVRNVDGLGLADIEATIRDLAIKARSGKLELDELQGGTFTITNGGVFGSMLSTPIINPPQSAILGMHNIVERPVAIDGKVEIRPIMYLALSYDHRIIDGRESVSFLKMIKECLETPAKMLL